LRVRRTVWTVRRALTKLELSHYYPWPIVEYTIGPVDSASPGLLSCTLREQENGDVGAPWLQHAKPLRGNGVLQL
jgi:hypothetical protein